MRYPPDAMMPSATRDRYGLPLSTSSPAAREAYGSAVDLVLSAQAGAEPRFAEALAVDPDFALAAIGRARVLALCGRAAEARDAAAQARTLVGRRADALAATRTHLVEFPRDAMVLAPATGVFGLIAFGGQADRQADLLALLDALAGHYDD